MTIPDMAAMVVPGIFFMSRNLPSERLSIDFIEQMFYYGLGGKHHERN